MRTLNSDLTILHFACRYGANGCRTTASTTCAFLKVKMDAATQAYASAKSAAQADKDTTKAASSDTPTEETSGGDSGTLNNRGVGVAWWHRFIEPALRGDSEFVS